VKRYSNVRYSNDRNVINRFTPYRSLKQQLHKAAKFIYFNNL